MQFVQIEQVIIPAAERTAQIPEDTKKCPYIMRINGFLQTENAKTGDQAEVITLAGRKVKGKIVDMNPEYMHSFGAMVNELLEIGVELKGGAA